MPGERRPAAQFCTGTGDAQPDGHHDGHPLHAHQPGFQTICPVKDPTTVLVLQAERLMTAGLETNFKRWSVKRARSAHQKRGVPEATWFTPHNGSKHEKARGFDKQCADRRLRATIEEWGMLALVA